MARYHVEMTGSAREVYEVEADNQEEAMANWASGQHVITEAQGMEPVSAALVEN